MIPAKFSLYSSVSIPTISREAQATVLSLGWLPQPPNLLPTPVTILHPTAKVSFEKYKSVYIKTLLKICQMA